MLRSRVPYTEIQAKYHKAPKTIAAIAKAAGLVQRHHVAGSKEKQPGIKEVAVTSPAGQAENATLKAKLQFLNEFFKENVDYLFKNKKIQEFVIEHQEFDEVDKLCQA